MDPDQKFFRFLMAWAKKQGRTFIPQACDGRESPDLIDGMAVDDVWGWLLPEGMTEEDDDYFGCVEWSEQNGELHLTWNSCDWGGC